MTIIDVSQEELDARAGVINNSGSFSYPLYITRNVPLASVGDLVLIENSGYYVLTNIKTFENRRDVALSSWRKEGYESVEEMNIDLLIKYVGSSVLYQHKFEKVNVTCPELID